MVQANGGGLAPFSMTSSEAKQTAEMRTLTNEFPQVDQLIIVDTYYNSADQSID